MGEIRTIKRDKINTPGNDSSGWTKINVWWIKRSFARRLKKKLRDKTARKRETEKGKILPPSYLAASHTCLSLSVTRQNKKKKNKQGKYIEKENTPNTLQQQVTGRKLRNPYIDKVINILPIIDLNCPVLSPQHLKPVGHFSPLRDQSWNKHILKILYLT